MDTIRRRKLLLFGHVCRMSAKDTDAGDDSRSMTIRTTHVEMH